MHILIILSDFQPAKNPNQLRFEMLIPELTQCGIQISILSNHWGATADTSEFGDARIYRVGPDVKNISTSNPSNLQKVRVLLRSLYRKFTWPDGRMVWILPGVRKGNYLLKHEQIDGIWSVGIPFSTHLIGMLLKKLYPHLFWVLDIQDPLYGPNLNGLYNATHYKSLNASIQRYTLQRADHVFVTNNMILECLKQQHQKLPHKSWHVLGPISRFTRNNHYSKHKKIILFAGQFYHRLREPTLLWLFWKHLPTDWTLIICSNIPATWQTQFRIWQQKAENVCLYPRLSLMELNRFYTDATIILSIGNVSSIHLPSKVADLERLGTPILHLSQTQPDPVCQWFQNFSAFYPIDTSKTQWEQSITKTLAEIEYTNPVGTDIISNRTDPARIGKQIAAILGADEINSLSAKSASVQSPPFG